LVRHKSQITQTNANEFYLRLAKKADHIILNFTDLTGSLRGRTIPANMMEEAINGVGFDCSSIPGGVSIDKSDMVMKPDDTFTTRQSQASYATYTSQTVKNLKETQGISARKPLKNFTPLNTTL